MDANKKALLTGLFYIFISLFEIAESVLPWIRYCQIEFSFLSAYALDDGLSYHRSRLQSYNMLKESLCGYFKPVVENACPELCTNIENIQNAGLLLLSCNIICILMHIFLAYLFISKARQRFEGDVPGLACWTMAIIKVVLGIIYFEIAGPKSFKTTWQYGFDVFLSFGFYFYFVGAMSEMVVSYFIYNLETPLERYSGGSKLSS